MLGGLDVPTNSDIMVKLIQIESRLTGLEAMAADTKGVIEAWKAVKSGGALIKWSSLSFAAIGSAWLTLKNIEVK